MGGGGNLNLTDNGPESIPRRETANSKNCKDLKAGQNGTLVGTNINLGFGIGPYGVGFSAQGGSFYDGTGDSFSQYGFTRGFNAQGGAATVEVISWGKP